MTIRQMMRDIARSSRLASDVLRDNLPLRILKDIETRPRRTVTRLLNHESSRVLKLSAGCQPEDAVAFLQRVGRWYPHHAKWMVRMLAPLCDEPAATSIVERHVAKSLDDIRSAQSFDEVRERAQAWPARVDTILDELKGKRLTIDE